MSSRSTFESVYKNANLGPDGNGIAEADCPTGHFRAWWRLPRRRHRGPRGRLIPKRGGGLSGTDQWRPYGVFYHAYALCSR
jgi:hypothetical protein